MNNTMSPPANRMSNSVLGMILLVAMETMLFSGMIGAYIVVRNLNTVWPPMNGPQLNLTTGALATAVIIISNLALAAASWFGRPGGKGRAADSPDHQARRRRELANGQSTLERTASLIDENPAHGVRRRRVHGAILVALLFGLAFSLMQVQEWRLFVNQGLLGYGVDMTPAPEGGFLTLLQWHMGRSAYGAFFFMLTITHALHLWTGMIILAALALRNQLWAKVGRLGTRLEVTAWFWHFIGVAWLFLFWLLYLQG